MFSIDIRVYSTCEYTLIENLVPGNRNWIFGLPSIFQSPGNSRAGQCERRVLSNSRMLTFSGRWSIQSLSDCMTKRSQNVCRRYDSCMIKFIRSRSDSLIITWFELFRHHLRTISLRVTFFILFDKDFICLDHIWIQSTLLLLCSIIHFAHQLCYPQGVISWCHFGCFIFLIIFFISLWSFSH